MSGGPHRTLKQRNPERFVALWQAGATCAEIAKQVGLGSAQAVSAEATRLRRRGYVLFRRRPGRRLT